MIYLSGHTSDAIEPALIERGIGLVVQPGNGYGRRVARYRCWAADNGCYSSRWEEDSWLRWLDRLDRGGCLFAVAPDVYPDAVATLERSAMYFDLLREMGYPVALVAQDGAEHLTIPWDDIDCLFIGGENTHGRRPEWKVGAGAEKLAGEARARGKWVHMGRVNSLRRMARARSMGCHSADGTFLAKAPDTNLSRMGVWMTWLHSNPSLPLRIFETPSLPVHRDATTNKGASD